MGNRSRKCRLQQIEFFKLKRRKTSGFSEVEMVSHRVLRLFSSISEKHQILFSPSFAKYAASTTETCPKAIAKQRITEMYDALINAPFDVPKGIPAAIGFMIDTHVPLLLSDCKTVHMAYQKKLAPEYQSLFPVSMAECKKITLDLWQNHDTENSGALLRLLRKGGPFNTSVRYVGSQIKRCLELSGTREIVGKIIRLSLLGAYGHAKIIAHPQLRVKIYACADKLLPKLFAEIKSRTSHDHFYVVSEFVLATSRVNPSIWEWIQKKEEYQKYADTVERASDNIRRGKRAPRVIHILAPKTWREIATSDGLVKCAAKRKKIGINIQLLLGTSEIQRIFSQTVMSKSQSYVDMLCTIIDPSLKCFADCKNEIDQKNLLSSMPPKLSAQIEIFSHGLMARKSVAVSPLTKEVCAAQRYATKKRSGLDTHLCFICLACGTWRSKAPIAGISRSKIGIQITLPLKKENFSCNGCSSNLLVRVNMVGNAVKARPKSDSTPVWIALCCSCGFPAYPLKYDGIRPLCNLCYKNRHEESTFCYFCNSTSKKGVKSLTIKENGQSVVITSCSQHFPKFLGYENLSFEDISKLSNIK